MAGLPQPGGGQRDQSKFIVFENFEKMNTQSVRQALSEKELAWLENLQPIAPNNLTTVPAPARAALQSISGSITSMFYADISGTDYFITFTAAGSGYAVNIATGALGHFAPDGTFSPQPDVTTWQASRVLINDPKAGYCTFDGVIFVRQGGVSPNITVTAGGTGYAIPPTITITGGSGTGATAVGIVENGSLIGIQLTNPGVGYQVGDTLGVQIIGASGSGAAGHVTMTGFPISSITLLDGGSFTFPGSGAQPLVFSGGGGTGASGVANVVIASPTTFTISSVSLTGGGSGYTSTPTVQVSGLSGALVVPAISAFLGTESVASIVLDAQGSGYPAAPAVVITGSGGATAHSTESGGAVTSLVLDNPGAGYTSTPSVIIASSGATATAIAHVWPFIPAGTTLAVFQGRVWLGGGQLLQWTGTGGSYADVGYDDFLAADASGSLLLSDADLVHAIFALRSLNNYLWIVGDNSLKQIGNISISAEGDVTLFTILTISSDQGSIFPKSCISYNRVFMFVNPNGVYGVFGSSVQKLSGDMDGIFKLVDFSLMPQGAVGDINAIHNALFLVRYKDPIAGPRSLILAFDGKKWFVLSQGNSLAALVNTASQQTDQNAVYGSSGPDVTQLLADATIPVTVKFQSALTHHGNAVQGKKTIRSGFAVTLASGAGTVTMTVDTENGSQSYIMPLIAGFQLPYKGADGSGRYLGQTLTGTLAGFTVTNQIIEYQETALWG